MSNGNQPVQFRTLRDLVRQPPRLVGMLVWVDEIKGGYWALGNLPDHVRREIDWPYTNVWMPDHVFQDLSEARVTVFTSPIDAAAALLRDPLSVYEDVRDADSVYLITQGEVLRNQGVLLSKTARYVDAVVEFRRIQGETLPRLFHLSPRGRNYGGKPLWP